MEHVYARALEYARANRWKAASGLLADIIPDLDGVPRDQRPEAVELVTSIGHACCLTLYVHLARDEQKRNALRPLALQALEELAAGQIPITRHSATVRAIDAEG